MFWLGSVRTSGSYKWVLRSACISLGRVGQPGLVKRITVGKNSFRKLILCFFNLARLMGGQRRRRIRVPSFLVACDDAEKFAAVAGDRKSFRTRNIGHCIT